MKERSFDPGVLVIIVMVLLLAGLGVFIYLQVKTDDISLISAEAGNVTVLYTVTDESQILLSAFVVINTRTLRMASLDIPDNLGALFGALGRVDSVGVLYHEMGSQEYRNFLKGILGQDIQFWLTLDSAAFSRMVDLLGGLDIFIPDTLDYEAENRLFRIPSGRQVLDGEKILDYLQYRDSEEREQDLRNRRWAVTRAFISGVADHAQELRDRGFFDLFWQQIQTNLDPTAFQGYVGLLAESNQDDMISQGIMGNTRLVETAAGPKRLLFPHFEGRLLKESLDQIIANLENAEVVREGGGKVRLEILNATDQTGLAQRTRELYSNYGMEVNKIGNFDGGAQDKTTVIDRKGNENLAKEVAKVIRCENILTQLEAGGEENIDVTVILGRDFNGWTVRK